MFSHLRPRLFAARVASGYYESRGFFHEGRIRSAYWALRMALFPRGYWEEE